MTQLAVTDVARHSRMSGVGAYRPRRVVPNSEIVEAIDSSDEWIRTRSGIVSRRIAGPDETVQMMSVAAAEQAIKSAGITASDSRLRHRRHRLAPAHRRPPVATIVTDELGSTPAAAFDISAACAGFCHGVALGSDMVRLGTAEHVLVIGVERLSGHHRPASTVGRPSSSPTVPEPSVISPSDDARHRPRRLGLGRCAGPTSSGWTSTGTRCSPAAGTRLADAADGGQRGISLGVVRDGEGGSRGSRPGRDHRRGPGRVHPPSGQHAGSPTPWPAR
ncbi:MAG: hypothetical protein WKF83_00125 [Nocardioidaceae bacterium]